MYRIAEEKGNDYDGSGTLVESHDPAITKMETFDEEMKHHAITEMRPLSTLYKTDANQNNIQHKEKPPQFKKSGSTWASTKSLFNTIGTRVRQRTAHKANNFAEKYERKRSELPSAHSHFTFKWNDINVWVGNGQKKKQILYDMNGSISSGELMAIMGGSGAGKSTLLNILSGRTNLNKQNVSGTFSINGKSIECSQQNVIKSLCSFVPQSDVLCSTQTVSEALTFYAKLKLCNKSIRKQMKRIWYLMDVLHLGKCADSIIGEMNESSSKKGISGGERRRVSIAAEIINDVDIIFLDEPTSGLDAYTAAATIKTLKEYCTESNKMIIATIHQPSMDTYYLFDSLILLSRGKCCFNSCLKDVDTFFKDSLRPRSNPADVIVFEIQQNPDVYAERWELSDLNAASVVLNKKKDSAQYTQEDLVGAHNNLNNAPWTLQLRLLLQREFQALYRDKRLSLIRLMQVAFFAVASGTIYYQLSDSFGKKIGAFFLITILGILFGMVSLLVVFPKQKVLFQREYNSNTYSLLIFALSFILIEIPRELIHMLIFVSICYPMMDLDGDFTHYWINLSLCSLSGGSFGMLFGVICSSTVEATQMVPASLVPILMFSDAMVSIDSLPQWLGWVGYIDPMYYLMRCFMIIEFDGAVYPRSLSDDEQYICDSYTNSTVGTQDHSYTNITKNDLNQGTLYTNCSVINGTLYTNTNNNNNSNINVNGSSTYIDELYHNIPKETEYTTTMYINEENAEKIDAYCSEEVSASYIFNKKNLDPADLVKYWVIVLGICVVVRAIALTLMYIVNNGISVGNLVWNVIKKCFSHCFRTQSPKQLIMKQISKSSSLAKMKSVSITPYEQDVSSDSIDIDEDDDGVVNTNNAEEDIRNRDSTIV